MNFVGHAMVARWERDHAGFAFGAMLPDLQRMSGVALAGSDDTNVADGIACHHRVDAAFHDAPTFVALCHAARKDLRAYGVARPTMLAASHVGIELLLDGCLVDQPGVVDGYLAAIEAGVQSLGALQWTEPDAARRFAVLCDRIGLAEAPRGYADPVIVAERIVAMLSRRPRLVAPITDHARLRDWAIATRPAVAAAAPKLLHELASRLS